VYSCMYSAGSNVAEIENVVGIKFRDRV
jgi:hypothetical protein